ncbi:MAG: hypothetical protein Kow0089_04350 [Desulfobulbaceae bacterium]
MRKRLFIGIPAGLAVLLALGFGLLFFSRSGLYVAVGVVRQLVPELAVDSAQGRLLDRFSLQGVRYRDDETDVLIEHIDLTWRPVALVRGLVDISTLSVSTVILSVHESSGKDGALPPFRLPLSLHVHRGMVDSLVLRTTKDDPGTESMRIEAGNLLVRGETIRFDRCEIVSRDFRVAGHGEVRTGEAYTARLDLTYSFSIEGLAPFSGSGVVAGPLDALGVETRLTGPEEGVLTGTLTNLVSGGLFWQGSLRADRIDLSRLHQDWPAVFFERAEVKGEGSFENYTLQVTSGMSFDTLQGVGISGTVAGDETGLRFSGVRIEQDGNVVTGEGDISWQDELQWAARITSEGIDLQRFREELPGIRLGGLRLSGRGSAAAYTLEGETTTTFRAGGDIPTKITARGNPRGFDHVFVRLAHGEAGADLEGRVTWEDGVSWDMDVSGRRFDPSLIDARLPGRLDLSAVTVGALREGHVRARVDLRKFEGEVRGYPVRAAGGIIIDGGDSTFDSIVLQSSDSILSLSGLAGGTLDLEFSLDSPDLEAFWPGLAGSLQARGKVTGTRARPVADFVLSGHDIVLESAGIGELSVVVQGNLVPEGTIQADIHARNVAAGDGVFDVTASLHGLLRDHALNAGLAGPLFSGEISMRGGYADGRWQGSITSGSLTSEYAGAWHVQGSVPLTLASDIADLGRLCLEGPQAALVCAEGKYAAEGNWNGDVVISSLPVSLFPALKKRFREVRGRLDGTASLRGIDSTVTAGGLDLTTDGLAVLLEPGEAAAREISWKQNRILATYRDRAAELELQSVLSDGGTINVTAGLTDLDIYPFSGNRADVQGHIRFAMEDLQPVNALSFPLAQVTGRLRGEVDVSGKLGRPEFKGELLLEKGTVTVPSLGTGLTDVRVDVEGRKDRLNFTLRGNSGGGALEAEGDWTPTDSDAPSLQVRVMGEHVEMVNLPEAKVRVSPELAVKIGKDRAELAGDIHIDEAYFSAVGAARTIQPSRDVVLVEERGGGKKTFPLYADITLFAGENTRINAYGLKGRVAGKLQVLDSPGRTTIGRGDLEVRDGTFTIYGRQLQIIEGRLFYSENPLDNPGVEVRAENTTGGVTTGIAVSGFLQKPDITFYSSPVMEQDEIIRRLLVNTTLIGSSSEEGLVGSVAADTGLDPVSAAIQDVKETLRVDEIRIETGRTSEDLALVIGTWLTPKLYVSYGRSLLAESSSFLTRYLLGHGFSVETESGFTQSGVDLKYEVER